MALHHPDGCLAYRLEHAGRTLIFATDHEHGDPAIDAALIEFSRGAEYLIYDATYLPPEYESLRRGWGHSTWYAAVAIARAASVKNLVLFHHHPDHTDDELEAVERVARAEFPATVIAREGMELPF
jgi:ribonuclease BN (tRNA processing enzyme)